MVLRQIDGRNGRTNENAVHPDTVIRIRGDRKFSLHDGLTPWHVQGNCLAIQDADYRDRSALVRVAGRTEWRRFFVPPAVAVSWHEPISGG